MAVMLTPARRAGDLAAASARARGGARAREGLVCVLGRSGRAEHFHSRVEVAKSDKVGERSRRPGRRRGLQVGRARRSPPVRPRARTPRRGWPPTCRPRRRSRNLLDRSPYLVRFRYLHAGVSARPDTPGARTALRAPARPRARAPRVLSAPATRGSPARRRSRRCCPRCRTPPAGCGARRRDEPAAGPPEHGQVVRHSPNATTSSAATPTDPHTSASKAALVTPGALSSSIPNRSCVSEWVTTARSPTTASASAMRSSEHSVGWTTSSFTIGDSPDRAVRPGRPRSPGSRAPSSGVSTRTRTGRRVRARTAPRDCPPQVGRDLGDRAGRHAAPQQHLVFLDVVEHRAVAADHERRRPPGRRARPTTGPDALSRPRTGRPPPAPPGTARRFRSVTSPSGVRNVPSRSDAMTRSPTASQLAGRGRLAGRRRPDAEVGDPLGDPEVGDPVVGEPVVSDRASATRTSATPSSASRLDADVGTGAAAPASARSGTSGSRSAAPGTSAAA